VLKETQDAAKKKEMEEKNKISTVTAWAQDNETRLDKYSHGRQRNIIHCYIG
jgi:hypothetical protein